MWLLMLMLVFSGVSIVVDLCMVYWKLLSGVLWVVCKLVGFVVMVWVVIGLWLLFGVFNFKICFRLGVLVLCVVSGVWML